MTQAQYKPLKIAVLNLSGNVGKTTLAVHLLAAYRPGAKFLSVETINSSEASDVTSLDVEEFSASQFKHIYTELMMGDDLILDVGASNVSRFMEELTKVKSAVGELDLVVIPTVPAIKQQKDTYTTINWLAELGVPASKIRVIFNQFGNEGSIGEAYSHVVGYAETDGQKKATWLPQVVLEQNSVFEYVKSTGKTIRQLADDPTDWKAVRNEAKAAKNMEKALEATDNQMARDLAITATANLEKAYEDLLAPLMKAAKK